MGIEKKYKYILERIEKAPRPVVFVNGATHGDEKIGVFVGQILSKTKITKGSLFINIANEKAFKKGVRFIDQDLNRSAPGNPQGNYEERLAYYLGEVSKRVDVFFDIHSTTSELKDALIVTKLNDKIKEIIKIISPKLVLVMKATGNKALMSQSKIGIAFEYGKDNKETAAKVIRDIKKVLFALGMIKIKINILLGKPKVFVVKKAFKKSDGHRLHGNIKNVRLVKKGRVVATSSDGKKIIAKEDFHPILFGQDNYDGMFGFMGHKTDLD